MLALSTIAPLKGETIFQHFAEIRRAMDQGSVITVDNGVKTLAIAAAETVTAARSFSLTCWNTCAPAARKTSRARREGSASREQGEQG
jgi:hypothetical protein